MNWIEHLLNLGSLILKYISGCFGVSAVEPVVYLFQLGLHFGDLFGGNVILVEGFYFILGRVDQRLQLVLKLVGLLGLFILLLHGLLEL